MSGETVTLQVASEYVPAVESERTVMSVVPAKRGVTNPVSLTVATEGFEDDQMAAVAESSGSNCTCS